MRAQRSNRTTRLLQRATSSLLMQQAFSTFSQMQHGAETMLESHGFGMIKHEPSAVPANRFGFGRRPSVEAAPAADLQHTSVSRGLGTGASDPYTRTRPNLELSAPAPTVVDREHTSLLPSVDEVAQLGLRRESLRYWIGGQHPRLPQYLTSLKTGFHLPLSPRVESLLEEFEATVIPAQCAESGLDASFVLSSWSSLKKRFQNAATTNVLSKAHFDEQIERAVKQALALFSSESLPSEELRAAVQLLERSAVQRRNNLLDQLASAVDVAAITNEGDTVWASFLAAVKLRKETWNLMKPDGETTDALEFVWESIVEGPAAAIAGTPLVSASVALYFLMIAAVHTDGSAWGKSLGDATRVDISSVSELELRKFVHAALEALGERVFTELSHEALLAVNASSSLVDIVATSLAAKKVHGDVMKERVKSVVPLFRDAQQASFLISRTIASTDDTHAKQVIQQTLSVHGFPVASDIGRHPTRWATTCDVVASALLSDSVVCDLLQTMIRSDIASAQRGAATNSIVSEAGNAALLALKDLRNSEAIRETKRHKLFIESLSSSEGVRCGLRFIERIGVDVAPLHEIARASQSNGVPKPLTQQEVVTALCAPDIPQQIQRAVEEAHPSWVKAGVVAKITPDPRSPAALRQAVRMYVRMMYVPQAATAMIARNTRRRIGAIGTSPHEQNVTVEIGMVEKYDNLLHKRYDWQGWYQRMVDVHNRNISIRCTLHGLRTLTGQGVPFFDMQSERRLRIVAKDRVGMSIVKLDSDKYEDQQDNLTYGSTKLSQLLADARKTMLGPEYVPTVEVKVRRPSGQSKLHYSTIDSDRVEKRSQELYKRYVELKKKSFFVPPTDLWLDVKGLQTRKSSDAADADGYTMDLFESLRRDE